jgi:HK97 gp10 family phage protein
MDNVVIHLDTEKLDQIADRLQINLEDVLIAAAFEIERNAKNLAPYDTGALKNSVYTNTKGGSDMMKAGEAVIFHNAMVEIEPLPLPEGKTVAIVGPSVLYAAYVEFGTSRAAAQPYLTPAFESVANKYQDPSQFKKVVE